MQVDVDLVFDFLQKFNQFNGILPIDSVVKDLKSEQQYFSVDQICQIERLEDAIMYLRWVSRALEICEAEIDVLSRSFVISRKRKVPDSGIQIESGFIIIYF